jgi:N-formylglutamate amidohydrolase
MQPIIHVPHASTRIPERYRAPFLLSDDALIAEALTSADLWIDALARAAWPGAEIIKASVSRIVCDVERYADDTKEPMAEQGRGMICTRTHDGRPMRRALNSAERQELKAAIYDPHWVKLREAAAGHVLVDLHSYPIKPWPVELNGSAPRPEISIGASPGLTPSRWIEVLIQHFEHHGYDPEVNTPYDGVIDAGSAAAVMIEVRRDLIGDGPGSSGWGRLVETLGMMPITLWMFGDDGDLPASPPGNR